MNKDNHDKTTTDAFGVLMDIKQVKAIIKEKGWNQKEIASYWGFTPKHISALVLNKNGLRGLRDDCAFLGLPCKN